MGKDAGFTKGLEDSWFSTTRSGQILSRNSVVVAGATIVDVAKAWP